MKKRTFYEDLPAYPRYEVEAIGEYFREKELMYTIHCESLNEAIAEYKERLEDIEPHVELRLCGVIPGAYGATYSEILASSSNPDPLSIAFPIGEEDGD